MTRPESVRLVTSADAQAEIAGVGGVRGYQPPTRYIDDTDRDHYLDSATDEVLDCREMGHSWPRRSEAGLKFKPVGNHYLRILPCRHCGLAQRQEKWVIIAGRNGKIKKCEFVEATVIYLKPLGEPGYLLPPGQGRYLRRDLREDVVNRDMVGQQLRKV